MALVISPDRPPLALAEMARTGWWFCRACQRVSSPRDGTEGEAWAQKCELCGASSLVFNPGTMPPAPECK